MAKGRLGKDDRVGGKYVIEEAIGHGGMSVVYRARNENTRKVVALKVLAHQLDPQRQKLWLQEAQIEETIGDSPHLVKILDADIDTGLGRAFLVMELLDGQTAEHYPFSRQQALEALGQLAGLLAQAHGKGVVHRDLKPQNLFLLRSPEGAIRLKVLDFGAARVQLGDQHTATQLGTALYSAPEQRGAILRKLAEKSGLVVARDVSAATDVWAFGLIAYEFLTGYGSGQLWGGQDSNEQIIDGIPRPSEAAGASRKKLPPGFDDWFARCVNIDASKRFPGILQAYQELVHLCAPQDTPAPPLSRPETALGIQTMGAEPSPPASPPRSTPVVPPARDVATSMDSVHTHLPEATTEPAQAEEQAGRAARPLVLGAVGLALVLGLGGWVRSRNSSQEAASASAASSALVVASASATSSALVAASASAAAASAAAEALQKQTGKPPAGTPDRGLKPPPEWPSGEARPESGAMVKLEGGSFRMGSSDGEERERPVHEVEVATFWMDVTEVTVSAYKACVDAGACSKPDDGGSCNWNKSDRGNHPINCVDWTQASAFCRWANKRLPTEEEWEYAARGTKGAEYPWGETKPSNQLCWDGEGNDLGKVKRHSTCAVGSYPSGNTPTGLKDMAGNVWEWTASQYCPYTDNGYDVGKCETARVDRGGGWGYNFVPSFVRGASRDRFTPSVRGSLLGFRCARADLFYPLPRMGHLSHRLVENASWKLVRGRMTQSI